VKTKCRHYNGPIRNDCCAVGVNYRKLGDDSKAGYIVRLPCVVGSPLSKDQVVCDKIDLFTPVELKKLEQEMLDRMDAVAKAISEIRKTKQQSGHVKCPTCSNKLHFSIAKSNGHLWGKCETDKCLSWME